MTGEPSQLPSELRTLVKRYGTRVLEDADGLRATLDDFLDEGAAAPGDVNLLVDAVRFGSLDRLKTLLGQGAEPAAATADVGEALAQRRGGDAESAYWACAVLGYAADLLPAELVPGTWERPSSQLPRPPEVTDTTSTPTPETIDDTTYLVGQAAASPPPTDGGDASPAVPSVQSAAGHRDARPTKRRRSWPLIAGILAAAVIVAAGVYLVFLRGGDSTPAASAQHMQEHEVPVSDILTPFGHFGTPADFQRALMACNDAAAPGSKPAYNCRFNPQYGPFYVYFDDQDPYILNRDGNLPSIVQNPARNTKVTQERADAQSYHAYYMLYKTPGKDGIKNTGDDQVALTLYDVDPQHPGSATFSAEDSKTNPLTQTKANQLLSAIGFDKNKFPLPVAFGGYPDFQKFARTFVSTAQYATCVSAFTQFRGEFAHVTCPVGPTTIDFGYIRNLGKVTYATRGGQQHNWTDTAGNTGHLNILSHNNQTHLYWYQDNQNQTWGSLSINKPGAYGELLRFFEQFQDHPTVQ